MSKYGRNGVRPKLKLTRRLWPTALARDSCAGRGGDKMHHCTLLAGRAKAIGALGRLGAPRHEAFDPHREFAHAPWVMTREDWQTK